MGRIGVWISKLATITGGPVAVPMNSAGEELCLTFHTRGGCYDNCKKVSSHCELATSDEAKNLAFITEGQAKIDH